MVEEVERKEEEEEEDDEDKDEHDGDEGGPADVTVAAGGGEEVTLEALVAVTLECGGGESS